MQLQIPQTCLCKTSHKALPSSTDNQHTIYHRLQRTKINSAFLNGTAKTHLNIAYLPKPQIT
ncbi:hypothetical protein SALWKB12_0051 [Snodgrassella communis]|nr:hypothetical protein SALWKB12_0051 [Snodgrassella communis]